MSHNTPANWIAMPNCLFSVLLMWQPITTLSRYDTIYCQSTILLGWTTLIRLPVSDNDAPVCVFMKNSLVDPGW